MPKYHLNAVLELDHTRTSWPGASVVSGVLPDDQGVGWSWISPHSTVRFKLDEAAMWVFEAKITAVEAVLAKTGPQTENFLVNGHPVKTLVLDHAGSWEVQVPLPDALPADTTVELVSEPCLAQPEGLPLCVLLHRVGFTRELR